MSTEKETRVNAIPEGYHTVTPFIIVKGAAQLMDFMRDAFNAIEIARVPSEDGKLGHAEMKIGNSVVMMFDAKEDWPETPSFLRLYIEDCDVAYKQALKAGAFSVTEPTDMLWGDRVSRVGDPFGNLWWIQTRMENLSIEEMESRFGEKKYIDAMKYVQSANFFPNKKTL